MTEVLITADQMAGIAYGLSMVANAVWFIAGLLVFD